jgi:hypothetical protein
MIALARKRGMFHLADKWSEILEWIYCICVCGMKACYGHCCESQWSLVLHISHWVVAAVLQLYIIERYLNPFGWSFNIVSNTFPSHIGVHITIQVSWSSNHKWMSLG